MLAMGEEFLLCAMQARNLTSLSAGPKTFSGYVLQVRDTGPRLCRLRLIRGTPTTQTYSGKV
jgi:hypothetical protein